MVWTPQVTLLEMVSQKCSCKLHGSGPQLEGKLVDETPTHCLIGQHSKLHDSETLRKS